MKRDAGMKTRIQYEKGTYYEGEVRRAKRHGEGRMVWANGKTLEGMFSNDYPVKGTFTWPTGGLYTGTFNQWKREGFGKMRYRGGDEYTGEWKADQRHGEGRMVWPNGNVFEGIFGNDDPIKGKHTWADGTVYDGTWKEWKRDGYGECVYPNGRKYTGEWKADLRHGKGRMVWPDGRTFEGIFSDDFPVKGKHTWPDGEMYDGAWKQWTRDGFGECVYPDSRKYTGDWKANLRHGKGRMVWPDGRTFEGIFSDDFPVKGKHTWPDGDMYDGTWKKWARDGYGMYVFADGEKYTGEWKDDKRSGKGVLIKKNGTVQDGMWKDDAFVIVSHSAAAPQEKEASADSRKTTAPHTDTERGQPSGSAPDAEQSVRTLLKTGRYLTDRVSGENAGYPAMLQRHFSALVGMEETKKLIAGLYTRLQYDIDRQKLLGLAAEKRGYYFVITGNPGTGKTTVARIIASLLNEIGALPEAKLIETDRSGLVGEYIGHTAKLTAKVIDEARGGTLFIDEAYSLYKDGDSKDFGVEAINTLLKDMEDHRGEYAVILAGYRDQMETMLRKANPGFASRFDHMIHIPDYTVDELVRMVVKQALRENYVIEKEAGDVIARQFREKMLDLHFDNGRCARKLLERAKDRLAARVVRMKQPRREDFQILKPEDFGGEKEERNELEQHLAQLNEMVGLSSVKETLNRIIGAVKVKKEMESRHLPGSAIGSLNFCFTGNPGTGKTTVARLLGKIFYDLGLLQKKDCFVECDRADLVSAVKGQTAAVVKDTVESALGGVLFIDEAYALVNAETDTVGLEAVNALVPLIEKHRRNLIVILAGYTDKMEIFMESNPGLASRFSHTVEFPDYTDDELAEIFLRMAKRSGYIVACQREELRDYLSEKRRQAKDFGNARGVRNLLESAISNLQHRIARQDLSTLSDAAIITIRAADLQ